MEWIKGLNNAINYMEEHITEPIDYERIAQEMNISSYYFQKLFSILCGCNVSEYVRNRRLTLAGSELLNTDEKIIDIAFKYGYDTPEGFARAFTRFHGVTPSRARNGDAKLKSFSKLSITISLKGGDSMDYRIEKKKGFKIIAKTQRFCKIENVIGREDIPQFWAQCHKDGTVKKLGEISKKDGVLGGSVVGLCMEDSTVVKDFPYSIGCEYDGGEAPNGYNIYDIPEAIWVIFDSTGEMPHAMQDMWHKIFAEFFPSSDYKPAGNFDIEVYSSDNYHSEIWIAVEKK